MPSTISAGTTAGTAIAVAGDTTGNLAFQTNGTTTAMTINTSQNVGIGISSPNDILNLYKASRPYLVMQNATTGTTSSDGFWLGYGSDNLAFQVRNKENAAINFYTNDLERMRINSDGGLQTATTGGGSIMETFGCRAWVNFNGTGTPAIRASGNVSSITDNGTGDYTVNFSNAMPDANYSLQLSVGPSASGEYASQISIFSQTNSPFEQAPTTTTARFITRNTSFTFTDPKYLCVSVFR